MEVFFYPTCVISLKSETISGKEKFKKNLHLGWKVSFEYFSTFTISFFLFKTAVEKKLKHFVTKSDCKIL